MEQQTTQTVEELKQEISLLQAEIETLKAKKSIAECIRESFAQERPVRVLKRKVRHKTIGSKNPPQVEITILESDYEQLMEQAKSTAWVERKLSELKSLGDRLWHKMNHTSLCSVFARIPSFHSSLFRSSINAATLGLITPK